MRSLQGSEARPLTCAQPVIPGLIAQPQALALGVLVHLHRDRRPRADQGHLAAQHVHEVRELVERGAAQDGTDACDARVALVDRKPRADRLRSVHHGPQLQHLERRSFRPIRRWR